MPGRPSGAAKKKEAGKRTRKKSTTHCHRRKSGGREKRDERQGRSHNKVLSGLTLRGIMLTRGLRLPYYYRKSRIRRKGREDPLLEYGISVLNLSSHGRIFFRASRCVSDVLFREWINPCRP